MKIRSRLTIQFSGLVALILILSSVAIYYIHSDYRRTEFGARLKDKAISTARLLIEVEEIDKELLKIIDKSNISIVDERVTIYNYLNQEIYDSSEDSVVVYSKNILNKVRLENGIHFRDRERDVVGILFTDRYNRFVVMVSAFDKYGVSKLQNLRTILILVFFISLAISVPAGWFFSGRAMKPVLSVVNQVEKISASNLNARVDTGNGTDEVAHLANTFNRMLGRLQESFEIQKGFVSNASHELRTPLTSVTGQLEVILMKTRTDDEYRQVIQSVLEDIKHLTALSNGLLDMTRASQDKAGIKMKELRVDEILWQSRADVLKNYPEARINIDFESEPDSEDQLLVYGNELLLRTAFQNLIDNGIKFSSGKPVEVRIGFKENETVIKFEDFGTGVSETDQHKIFEPFYRAEQNRNVKGHGLGLSLTQKIIELHSGDLILESKNEPGAIFSISLPVV